MSNYNELLVLGIEPALACRAAASHLPPSQMRWPHNNKRPASNGASFNFIFLSIANDSFALVVVVVVVLA